MSFYCQTDAAGIPAGMRPNSGPIYRGCRCARSPANCGEPSGFTRCISVQFLIVTNPLPCATGFQSMIDLAVRRVIRCPDARKSAMRQPHPLLKVASLVSSILLLGGFVAFRSNAFHWRLQAGADKPNVNDTRSATPPIPLPGTSTVHFDSTIDPFHRSEAVSASASTPSCFPDVSVMSGSKSDRIFFPPATATPSAGSTLMQSSKGGVIISNNGAPATNIFLPAIHDPDVSMMAGSKSIVLVPPVGQPKTKKKHPNPSQAAQRSR
jgi:hypothetical protein